MTSVGQVFNLSGQNAVGQVFNLSGQDTILSYGKISRSLPHQFAKLYGFGLLSESQFAA
jgi:hypothetical protein